MISISDVSMYDILPPNLNAPQIKALCAAWDEQYQKLLNLVEVSTMVWSFVDDIGVEMADHLCLSLDIKGYKADLALDKKRKLIKAALLNYSRLGTKSSLESAVGIIHGGTTIEENWLYGGLPYHFRARVDASKEDPGTDPVGRLLDTIMDYKNLRSWLDGLQIDMIEDGTLYSGAASEVGTVLMIEPYRIRDLDVDTTLSINGFALMGTDLMIGEV